MDDLLKFIRTNPDTEYTENDIVTAYEGDDVKDTYTNANNGIEEILERYHKQPNGRDVVNELHDGVYGKAFEWIKENI